MNIKILLFLILVVVVPLRRTEAYCSLWSEDGLPQHTITDILQDRSGFMWFSTWDGLSRFDGYTFKPTTCPVAQISITEQ